MCGLRVLSGVGEKSKRRRKERGGGTRRPPSPGGEPAGGRPEWGALEGPLGASPHPNMGTEAFVMSRVRTDHLSPDASVRPHHPAGRADTTTGPDEPLQPKVMAQGRAHPEASTPPPPCWGRMQRTASLTSRTPLPALLPAPSPCGCPTAGRAALGHLPGPKPRGNSRGPAQAAVHSAEPKAINSFTAGRRPAYFCFSAID